MVCHLPFLFPLAGLLLFAFLPLPTALAIYLPLTVVSLAFAVPAVRAMYQPATTGPEAMQGQEGVVVTVEGRTGLLRYEGELWEYLAQGPLAPGDRVSIVEINGLTALVRPVSLPRRAQAKGTTP